MREPPIGKKFHTRLKELVRNKLVLKMVTYIIGVLRDILVTVPVIGGRPTFKGLWDTHGALLEKLRKIKHPDHPFRGMMCIMMIPAAYALVSNTPWAVPNRVGELFEVL